MVEADDNYLTTREEMSRPNLQSAQHMMVHVENQKRSERTFETFISNCNHIDKKKNYSTQDFVEIGIKTPWSTLGFGENWLCGISFGPALLRSNTIGVQCVTSEEA